MNGGNPTSLPRRCGAMLYDGLLLLAILFAITLPVVALRGGDPVQPGSVPFQLLLVAVSYGFFVGFWRRYGRTLGMQSWNLAIETLDGRRPSVGQCSVRFAVAVISWLPFGLGFLWQLVDNDKLAWHDHLSGTCLRYYPKPGNKG